MKISQKLAKLLAENGCTLESKEWWHIHPESESYFIEKEFFVTDDGLSNSLYPAYSIEEDILVKYVREFFGENFTIHTEAILRYLQLGAIDDAEGRIWMFCLFNPKNK